MLDKVFLRERERASVRCCDCEYRKTLCPPENHQNDITGFARCDMRDAFRISTNLETMNDYTKRQFCMHDERR